jgi:hypothetical protein
MSPEDGSLQFGIQLSNQESHVKALNTAGFLLEFKSGASGRRIRWCTLFGEEL